MCATPLACYYEISDQPSDTTSPSAVRAGQVLVKLDDRDPRACLEQALAQVDQGKAGIVQAEAQIKQQQAQVAQLRAQLEATQMRR